MGIVVQMRVRGEDESENVQGPSTMLRIHEVQLQTMLEQNKESKDLLSPSLIREAFI